VVVSHDRYFLERVCDSVWALLGDGQVSMLPRGVDEYLERRAADLHLDGAGSAGAGGSTGLTGSAGAGSGQDTGPASAAGTSAPAAPAASAQDRREATKAVARLDKQLARLTARQAELHTALAASGDDYERLAALDAELREVTAEKDALEEEWLEAAELLE
jgi:ATP-binding cassette subfamily F protein uup